MIRHGYIGAHYDGRFVGSTDVPLAEEGLIQASALAAGAKTLTSAKCYCSPMLRAKEMANAMLKPIGIPYELDPNLREIDFGQWECMAFAEISASDPKNVSKWAEYSEDFSFPGGESISGFNTRVRDFATRAVDEPARTVLAITHGGVIRALICHFLGLDSRNYLLFDVKPASVSRIAIHGGKGVLTQLNDLCHLEVCRHG
ncbi:MAG: histidine phosphatase family protein [Armatimonadota bacterium]